MNTLRVIFLWVGGVSGAVPLLAQLPSISAIENNYSYTLPSVPNYGIAPGSLFVIFGSNLSTVTVPVLQSSAPPGVPLTLNNVSGSVAGNVMMVPVPLFYVAATQIAGVLPSTVPAGTGTITVTNNGLASAPAPFKVVTSNFGILTTNNLGYGPAAAFDATNKLLSATNSTSPGQTIVLYGTGVGADPANDDRVFPQKQNNLTEIPWLHDGAIQRGAAPGRVHYLWELPDTRGRCDSDPPQRRSDTHRLGPWRSPGISFAQHFKERRCRRLQECPPFRVYSAWRRYVHL